MRRRARALLSSASSRARGRRAVPPIPADAADLVLVVAEQNRGWILETISRHVAAQVRGTAVLHYLPEVPGPADPPLPPARAYFFSHYLLYLRSRDDPSCRAAHALVWFTHPSYDESEAPKVARALRGSTIVSGSTTQVAGLVAAGYPADRVHVITPGADPARFVPHEREGRPVGFVSSYYPRKAPEVVVGLVESMPHREFRLLGPNWEQAPDYARLVRRPNFRHLDLPYEAFPSFYGSIDVFVSPSRLEGGPIPLIEAMMANVVPVATRTGFGPDLVRDGENGFLCDVDAPIAAFAGLVEQAYALDGDVRSTVDHLTWESFGRRVVAVALPGEHA